MPSVRKQCVINASRILTYHPLVASFGTPEIRSLGNPSKTITSLACNVLQRREKNNCAARDKSTGGARVVLLPD